MRKAEEPRDILQAFRHSISLYHSGIELTLCRYEPSFSFSWPLFLFRSTHNFYYRYSRRKKYAKWEFKLWPCSNFFCLTRGPFLPPRRLWSKGSGVYHDRMLPIHHYSTYTLYSSWTNRRVFAPQKRKRPM